jgi:hypothetical protein
MVKIATFIIVGAIIWIGVQNFPPQGHKPTLPVTIGELAAEKSKYLGKWVRVTGTVTGRFTAIGITALVMEDNRGERLDVAGFTPVVELGDIVTMVGEYRLFSLSDSLQVPLLFVSNSK